MANWSRRSVLTLVAASIGEIGALAASAAAGAHFAVPAATVTTNATKSGTTNPEVDTLQGPLAAFIPDSHGDTIVLMRGEQVMSITDPALVQTLLSFASLH